jgi:hypothetical protein
MRLERLDVFNAEFVLSSSWLFDTQHANRPTFFVKREAGLLCDMLQHELRIAITLGASAPVAQSTLNKMPGNLVVRLRAGALDYRLIDVRAECFQKFFQAAGSSPA